MLSSTSSRRPSSNASHSFVINRPHFNHSTQEDTKPMFLTFHTDGTGEGTRVQEASGNAIMLSQFDIIDPGPDSGYMVVLVSFPPVPLHMTIRRDEQGKMVKAILDLESDPHL